MSVSTAIGESGLLAKRSFILNEEGSLGNPEWEDAGEEVMTALTLLTVK